MELTNKYNLTVRNHSSATQNKKFSRNKKWFILSGLSKLECNNPKLKQKKNRAGTFSVLWLV